MKSRQSLFALAVISLFGLNIAGASWLSLTGSDSEPFEMNYPAKCANPDLTVVYDQEDKKERKITAIVLSGDFSACLGSQLLVSVHKVDQSYNYAVKDIEENVSSISLFFEKQGTGDFHKRFPEVVNQRLVPSGPLAPPTSHLDIVGTKVSFSWSWS